MMHSERCQFCQYETPLPHTGVCGRCGAPLTSTAINSSQESTPETTLMLDDWQDRSSASLDTTPAPAVLIPPPPADITSLDTLRHEAIPPVLPSQSKPNAHGRLSSFANFSLTKSHSSEEDEERRPLLPIDLTPNAAPTVADQPAVVPASHHQSMSIHGEHHKPELTHSAHQKLTDNAGAHQHVASTVTGAVGTSKGLVTIGIIGGVVLLIVGIIGVTLLTHNAPGKTSTGNSPTSSSSSSPSSTSTPTSAPDSRNAHVSLVQSNNGYPGGTIILHGEHFIPGGTITVHVDNRAQARGNGPLVDGTTQVYGNRWTNVTIAVVRPDGTFDTRFMLPLVWKAGNRYTIQVLEQQNGKTAQAIVEIFVQPRPDASPTPIDNGTPTPVPTVDATGSTPTPETTPTPTEAGMTPTPGATSTSTTAPTITPTPIVTSTPQPLPTLTPIQATATAIVN